jgi:hypothetical protein
MPPEPAPVPAAPRPLYPPGSPPRSNMVGMIVTLAVVVLGVAYFAGHNAPSPSAPPNTTSANIDANDGNSGGGTAASNPDTSGNSDPVAQSNSCTPDQFKVTGLRGTNEYGQLSVVGTIRNTCAYAAGIQMKLTTYDKSGNVLNTEDEWPASVSNIPPDSPYPFKLMIAADDTMQKFNVINESVTKW